MMCYVKRYSDYKAIRQATVLSSSLVLDSLDVENSAVTVLGTGIGVENTGDWLLIDGHVYTIAQVKPRAENTQLSLASPLDAFTRPLIYAPPLIGGTIGSFVAASLDSGWVQEADPVYAMPYLTVSDLDTRPFVEPELDSAGCLVLPDYLRLMRKSYQVQIVFRDAGSQLQCIIQDYVPAQRQVSFDAGRSQLQSADFGTAGYAKITAIQEVADSEQRVSTTWYLAEDGTVSNTVPDQRAAGSWGIISVTAKQVLEEKVVEAFAKNRSGHKLEFWSKLDLQIQDACSCMVSGRLLRSYVSYKRKDSSDTRFFYKAGELATTASDKLKKTVSTVASVVAGISGSSSPSTPSIDFSQIYPVGAVYISADSTEPSVLFGGTWEKIKDRFLLAAGDTYAAASAGGQASHSHSLDGGVAYMSSAGNTLKWRHKSAAARNAMWQLTVSGNGSSSGSIADGIEVGGTSQATENLPPYLAVYVWKRVA